MNDYHVHTDFSDDCQTPMDDMIETAISRGISQIAITDHYDPDYPDPEFQFLIDFDKYYASLEAAEKKYADRIKVLKGIEVGIQKGGTLQKCRDTVHAYDYDFVIGSFHCFDGEALDKADYEAIGRENLMPRFYTYMYECLKEYKCYDVLGHFNVIDRYIPFEIDYSKSMDIIEAILKLIIEDGKGLELNTSSFRYGMGLRTLPAPDILKMYHDLGGEILTMGSDAHKPGDIKHRFSLITSMAQDIGFKYFAEFKGRKMTMVDIEKVP